MSTVPETKSALPILKIFIFVKLGNISFDKSQSGLGRFQNNGTLTETRGLIFTSSYLTAQSAANPSKLLSWFISRLWLPRDSWGNVLIFNDFWKTHLFPKKGGSFFESFFSVGCFVGGEAVTREVNLGVLHRRNLEDQRDRNWISEKKRWKMFYEQVLEKNKRVLSSSSFILTFMWACVHWTEVFMWKF